MIWTLMLLGLLAFVATVYLGIVLWLWLVERDRRQHEHQTRRVFESWREPREQDAAEGDRTP